MDLSYAYTNARVKAMKSKLFSEAKIRELLEVQSLPELIELMEESEYRSSFVQASTHYEGMDLISHALKTHWEDVLQKLIRITPGKATGLMRMFLREYEIQNLSAMMAAKESGVPLQDSDLVVLNPQNRAFMEELLQKDSVSAMAAALHGTEYQQPLSSAQLEYDKTRDFRVFIRALYGYHFKKLLELAGREKTPFVGRLVAWRIELQDLMILLRVKRANPAQDALPFLIHPEVPAMKELNAIKDFHTLLERVKAQHPSLAAGVDEVEKTRSLVPLEIALDSRFYSKVLKQLRLTSLDFSTVLGYLYLKQLEIGAVRKIAYAKQYGFSNELKGMLFRFSA